jgi:hypothetical protein
MWLGCTKSGRGTTESAAPRFPPTNGFLQVTTKSKIGDYVRWNSEAGIMSGTIVKVHTEDTNYKGYAHHARIDDLQDRIRSDKSDHVAMHEGRGSSENCVTRVGVSATLAGNPGHTRDSRSEGCAPVSFNSATRPRFGTG